MAKEKLEWRKENPSNFPEEVAKAYQGMLAARAALKVSEAAQALKDATDAFETAFIGAVADSIPEGKTLRFGYRFGGVATAVAEPASGGSDEGGFFT